MWESKHRIPVWIYGDEEKPLIFFIHGHFRGFSEYVGDLPMRYLRKNYCVVAFDLPGYGKSRELNMARTEFIKNVVEQISSGKPFVLFGVSYGGLLTIKYYLKYPEKVKGIIIGGMPYYFGVRKIINLAKFLPFLSFKNAVKEFSFLSKENLSVLKTPVLLLYSSKDHHATSKMGEALRIIIPNSKLFVINKYNHGWLMHRIDESGFLGELNRFIKNLK